MSYEEHPTPPCPNCGGEKTRPLDDEVATCFECDQGWRMTEETQEEISEFWDSQKKAGQSDPSDESDETMDGPV